MSWHHLMDEMRRRRVYRVSATYVIGAFALLQGADIVLPALGAPTWAMRVMVVLAIVGLPVAAVMAWVFEITPRGIERTEPRVTGDGASPFVMRGGMVAAGIFGVVALSLLVAGSGWVAIQRLSMPHETGVGGGAPDPGSPSHGASVAVLPCVDASAGRDAEYFGDGLTEEIIGELARFEGLKVISRTSVVALRDSGLTLPQIADTLRVQHVLECSIQRSGTSVRVSARLIDPRSDHLVWSEPFDREMTDPMRMQEEIARQVGVALLSRIPDLRPRPLAARSPSPEAYDAYLRGTAARRQMDPASLRGAIAAFEEAIERDPSFAPAYSGLAQVHVVWILFGYAGTPDPYERVALAFSLADRAVELDSASAEAWAARGHAGLRAWLPSHVVLADFDRAIRLAPSSGEIRLLRGMGLALAGRFEEAVLETEAAVGLDPLSAGLHDARAMSLILARRLGEALRAARLARALSPGFQNPIRQEARALLLLGRYEECAGLEIGPYLPLRAMCLHSSGRVAEARAIIDELSRAVDDPSQSGARNMGGIAADIAEYHAWLGDPAATIAWLGRSIEWSPTMQFLVDQTGTYDPVRHDPLFEDAFARIRDDIRSRLTAQGVPEA